MSFRGLIGRKTKYGNRPPARRCHFGFNHRSKLEQGLCDQIHLRCLAGDLEHLQHECHVYLSDARILYIADFKCRDLKTGDDIYLEAKGYATLRWPMIKKLWRVYGPGKLEIWKGTHQRICLSEVIIPKSTKEVFPMLPETEISIGDCLCRNGVRGKHCFDYHTKNF